MYRLVLASLLWLLTSGIPAIQTAAPMELSDAVAQGLVRIEQVAGNSSDGLDYAQPLLQITIVPAALTAPIDLIVSAGTELQPSDTTNTSAPPIVALRLAQSPLHIEPTQNPVVTGLVAFTTAPALYPTATQQYALGQLTTNQDLLALLQRIEASRNFLGVRLAPQMAVWQVATGKPFEDVDADVQKIFGVSLAGTTDATAAAALVAQPTPTASNPLATAVQPSSATGDDEVPSSGTATNPVVDNLPLILVAALVIVGIGSALFIGIRSSREPAVSQGPQANFSSSRPPVKTAQQASQSTTTARTQTGLNTSTPPPRGGRAFVRTAPVPGPNEQSTSGNNVPAEKAAQPQAGPQTREQPTNKGVKPDGRKRATQTDAVEVPAQPVNPQQSHGLEVPVLKLVDMVDSNRPPITAPYNAMITRARVYQTEIKFDEAGAVSSPHCVIAWYENSGWAISDLGSLNGTWIDQQQISQKKYPLSSGKEIVIGNVLRLQFTGDNDGGRATLTQLASDGSVVQTYTFMNQEPYWVLTAWETEQVEVEDNTVSTPHAFLTFDDGWAIRDLNSSSGTYITRTSGGQRLNKIGTDPKRIKLQDEIFLSARAVFRFESPTLPQLGEYQLDEWTGLGGMASVFRAHHPHNDQPGGLVVKLLTDKRPAAAAAFTQECKIMSMLKDMEYIVPYVANGHDREYGSYLVLGYIEGATLQSILRVVKQLDVAAVVKIGLCVCHALLPLHELGWIHCDIKPENIMIQQDGTLFVVDFGVSTLIGQRPSYATRAYGAPEIYSAANNAQGMAQPATDIYSVGLVLYEVLMGVSMPGHFSTMESGITHQSARRPGRVTQATKYGGAITVQSRKHLNVDAAHLHKIINRCTAPLAERYERIQDVIQDLSELTIKEYDLSVLPKAVNELSSQAW